MLRILSTLLLFGAAITGAGQHWAHRVGAWSNDAYNDVAVGADGSLYVVGEFGGNIVLPSETLVSQGSLDAVVAKYDAAGNLVWARAMGSTGLDRAIKLELTADGNMAVVGQFMGTVDFAGQSLTALGGTQDCFVLKMAQLDGAVLWARRGGSANGVDQPNGVSVAPDGSIAVAGEFRGTAVFDQGTIVSLPDPDTGTPSVDIFLATYAADGTPLWLVHGAAEYADRGMDVDHDPAGNLYLTGQFTDTLSLGGNIHPNNMYSAVFIARFNPQGQEDWFRVFGGGTYNQAFEMLAVDSSYLLLVGDAQGSLIYLDSVPDLFTMSEPRSSFLMKVRLDGEFIAQVNWGSAYPINTRAVSVQADDVSVLGRFTCQLTGFSGIYGPGTFMATGPWDLYVARFQESDLAFKEAQQFGGQGEKVPGGIVHTPDQALAFAGSFERLLVFPDDGGFAATPTSQLLTPQTPAPYCADGNYNRYASLRGSALKDAFIARGYVEGRQPYDFYHRAGAACDRSLREPYIVMGPFGVPGPDTLARCFDAALTVRTNTPYTADTSQRHIAPDFQFLWSTGQTTQTIVTQQSGWFWVDVSIGNGCFTWRDSLHLTVHPLPAVPWINDDVVVNTNASAPQTIQVCEPQPPWLWATNVAPANSVEWLLDNAPAASGDSVLATVSGLYTVRVTTPFGCTRTNQVLVIINPNVALPPFDLQLITGYPQDEDLDDTLQLCDGEDLVLAASATLLLNGVPVPMPYGLRTLHRCHAQGGWSPISGNGLGFTCVYNNPAPGTHMHSVGFAITNAPCGDDTLFITGTDTIYVEILPVVLPQLSAVGPALICPGDTVPLVGNCPNCTEAFWSGPGVPAGVTDTLWVTAPGQYNFSGSAVSPDGCEFTDDVDLVVQWNPLPTLLVDPIDGIICPNDSALIWTTAEGGDWQWYGPLGPLAILNDSIHTSQQGFYYLEMTDTLGCRVTSQPILVTDYSTPYLNVVPDNVICEPGEVSILNVVTTSLSTLYWEAPFEGSNALQQPVTQAGIYTVSVNACAITTVLSVEVFGNTATAALTSPGPFVLCPGDQVTLTAQPGQALYYWEPGPIFGTSITTDSTGNYLLVVSDPYGCRDSLWTSVTVLPAFDALAFVDSVFCVGDQMIATVSGEPTITWYADPFQSTVLGTGNALDLGTAQQSTTVWVEQVVGQCGSGLVEMLLAVNAPPSPPQVTGPLAACLGDSVAIGLVDPGSASHVWSTPQGTVTGPWLVIDPVTLAADGAYSVQAVVPGCDPATSAFSFAVNIPAPISIGNDTTICPGGTATYSAPSGFPQWQWSDGSTTPAYTTGSAGPVVLTALDGNGCTTIDSAMVFIFGFTQPLSVTGASICLGQSATLSASGSGSLAWFSDPGLTQQVHAGSQWFIAAPQDSAVFHVVQTEGGCASQAVTVLLAVTPVPVDAALSQPYPACEGAYLSIVLTGTNAPTGIWSTPTGPHEGDSFTVAGVTQANAGTYLVIPYIGGCAGDTLRIDVAVLVPMAPFLGPDTTLCDGEGVSIALPPGYHDQIWDIGSNAPAIYVTEPGAYYVRAKDPQGCAVADTLVVAFVPCEPYLPNVVTPNGDGWNDGWRLPPGGYVSALLRVWNRWGQIVWEGDATDGSFRGNHRNGEPLSEGTYYYEVLITRADGRVKPYTGYFSLLR